MKSRALTIGVSGLNAIDSPGSGMAVIKGLRESSKYEVRIIGFAYESMEPGLYMSEFVDKCYQVPYPSAGRDVLLERLRYINQQERIDVIIPNFDAELFNYIKLGDQIRQELGIRMLLPTEEQFEARHKSNLSAFGEEHQIKVPAAKLAYSLAECNEMVAEMGFPVVLKGKFYDAQIIYSLDQATQCFSKISAEWGLPVLVQEFVAGHEVNVCGIGDGQGETLGAVPMKKIYVTDKGKAWSGVTIDDKKLAETCYKLVSSTKWRGPFELEFMKSERDEYHLLEINPRFPAWCYLSVGSGQNQMEMLMDVLMGETVHPQRDYAVGKMFVRYSDDMIIDLKKIETITTTGEL